MAEKEHETFKGSKGSLQLYICPRRKVYQPVNLSQTFNSMETGHSRTGRLATSCSVNAPFILKPLMPGFLKYLKLTGLELRLLRPESHSEPFASASSSTWRHHR